jgi:hypothetical protein
MNDSERRTMVDDRGNRWEWMNGRWWREWLSYKIDPESGAHADVYFKPNAETDKPLIGQAER